MRKNLFILFVAPAIAARAIFTTKKIDPYELWSLALHVLRGLKNPSSLVSVWEVAQMYERTGDHLDRVVDALERYAKNVDSEDPDGLLATLTSGISNSEDDDENLRFFHEDRTNDKFMAKSKFDEYEISKSLYLGRAATGYPENIDEVLALIPKKRGSDAVAAKKELTFLKKYILCLAEVSHYEPVKIAAMLVAGGYKLKM
jgi:hypothetical protein